MARHFSKYSKEKNAGGYLAIAQGVKGVAPKSVDKLDEKIAGQIDGTNRPMVFGMPVYEEGGSIDEKRERVIDYLVNNEEDEYLIDYMGGDGEEFLEDRSGNYYEIYRRLSDNFDNQDIEELFNQYLAYAKGGLLDFDVLVDGTPLVQISKDDFLESYSVYYYQKEKIPQSVLNVLENRRQLTRDEVKEVLKELRKDNSVEIDVPLPFAKGGKVKRYIVHKNSGYDGEVVGSSDTFRGASMIQKRLEKKGVFDNVDSYGIKDTQDYFYRRKDNKYAKGGKVDTHIAETILVQLGGMNRLKMFTGAYNFGALPNGVSFRIKSRGYSLVNYVKITLTPADLYNVEYGRIHNNKYRVIEEDFGLYNDMLVRSFENATNMYLSFARGGSVENFDLMEEYEALSDQNKAIVNLLNLYNPKGRLPRPKQTLKQLNVDEQYMVRQWNVGLQNQVSEELVKKMWGLMYEHSTIKQDYVYNHNKGAGRFLMNAGSDTICQYDFGHNTHLMINDLGYLVDDEIVRSFAQRNASSKRDYNKKTSGHIGVVSAFELPEYLKMNEYSRYFYDNNKRGCLMVLIAPLKDGKVIEGITEVKKNIVIKNAFENGIDGQLVIKEM